VDAESGVPRGRGTVRQALRNQPTFVRVLPVCSAGDTVRTFQGGITDVTKVARLTIPAIATVLILSGCGGSSGTTATPPNAAATTAASTPRATKPRGSKLVVDKANGYQLAIPAGYVRITNKAQLKKIAKAGASAVANSGIDAQLLNKTVKMLAYHPKTNASLNVVVASSGGVTADQLPSAKSAIKKQVAGLGARNIAFKQVTMGGAPALRATYTIKLQGPRGFVVQYITVKGDQLYNLTFTQTTRLAPKIEKQTAGSWQFL
jgi:hypothetical protein